MSDVITLPKDPLIELVVEYRQKLENCKECSCGWPDCTHWEDASIAEHKIVRFILENAKELQ